MKYEGDYDEDRQRCILLLNSITSRMSDEVKLKIVLEGYTPLEIATIYIVDHIKYLVFKEGSINAENVVDTYESFHFLFVFDQHGNKIVDIIF